MATVTRRASIKRMPSEKLHQIAGALRKGTWAGAEFSEGQEWLWDIIISELERRHRRCRDIAARCHCEFCVAPFG